ncbi:MAG: glycine cleavage system protein GcvH [Armatimonadetes bacterium]|nr:glycine cleavage system protein GcvH [Armatimonadota bacterium]
MNLPENLRYTQSHEWTRVDGDIATVGITDFAQNELGDVVFVELPSPGRQLRQDDIFGSIESVKAVSDLISPVSGEVVEVNDSLTADPSLANQSPYDEAWMIKVRLETPSEIDGLMSADDYKGFVEE